MDFGRGSLWNPYARRDVSVWKPCMALRYTTPFSAEGSMLDVVFIVLGFAVISLMAVYGMGLQRL